MTLKRISVDIPQTGNISLAMILKALDLFDLEAAAAYTGKSSKTIRYHLGKGIHLKGSYLEITPKIRVWVCSKAELDKYMTTDLKSRKHLAKESA